MSGSDVGMKKVSSLQQVNATASYSPARACQLVLCTKQQLVEHYLPCIAVPFQSLTSLICSGVRLVSVALPLCSTFSKSSTSVAEAGRSFSLKRTSTLRLLAEKGRGGSAARRPRPATAADVGLVAIIVTTMSVT